MLSNVSMQLWKHANMAILCTDQYDMNQTILRIQQFCLQPDPFCVPVCPLSIDWIVCWICKDKLNESQGFIMMTGHWILPPHPFLWFISPLYNNQFRGSFTLVTSDKQTDQQTVTIMLDDNIYLLNSSSFSSMNIIHQ